MGSVPRIYRNVAIARSGAVDRKAADRKAADRKAADRK
jgi:hypothetical protein